MDVPLIQIDAFADRLFEGNPAAVMPLVAWPDDTLLQQLAGENNLSETAFLVPIPVEEEPATTSAFRPAGPAYRLRWFTPAMEVDLCGHATLATAAYLFDDVHPEATRLRFHTRSGWLIASRTDDGAVAMDFPAEELVPCAADPDVVAALGVAAVGGSVVEAFRATDLIYLVDSARTVRELAPDAAAMTRLQVRGVMVTAWGERGSGYDVVSRWFGAQAGVTEDPVTGSAHSQAAPLWAERLGRNDLVARQLSPRGGTVTCQVRGDRVVLMGRYRRYLTGTVTLP